MKVFLYQKTKKKIVMVETKKGNFILTEQGILTNDKDIDFGNGADKTIDV